MAAKWPVVPICQAQRLDVRQEDLLNNGLYRKCNTYHSGGGYDQFPSIYEKRFGKSGVNLGSQFVVQLAGCTLDCSYCYVTRAGVNGEPTTVTTEKLLQDFHDSGCGVFHLMGGAPAIYLPFWSDILRHLEGAVFHSDFVLNECIYSEAVLEEIARYKNALYAVSIKGSTPAEYRENTNTHVYFPSLMHNIQALHKAGINFYVTFTGMPHSSIDSFKEQAREYFPTEDIFQDSFAIELVHYNALDYST